MNTITAPSDYLVGDIKIANAVSGNPGEGLNADLVYIIEKYEKELLLKVLGQTQYDLLQIELGKLPFATDTEPPSLPTADHKWIDLVAELKPIMQNQVFCNWLRFKEVSVTTTGAGKSKVKNHSVTDYNQKYVERWNEMQMQLIDLHKYLTDSNDWEVGEYFPYIEFENQFGI